jgi:NAD(P)H-flavin reductase
MEEVTYTAIADPMVPTLYRVERYIRESHDTFTLGLMPSSAADLKEIEPGGKQYTFAPGQFNMLYVFGMGEVPICISASPVKGGMLSHTARAVGGVTRAMQALKVGDMIGVRGPFGSHWPIEESAGKDIVIVAGGMGLAPLRPAIQALIDNHFDFTKHIILYGTRSADDIIYKEDLENWRTQPGVELHIGGVRKILAQITFDPANTVALICGPDILMHFSVKELKRHKMSGDDIYVSMERNMKCAIGFCGHCQFGQHFICKDGPVFKYSRLAPLYGKTEI